MKRKLLATLLALCLIVGMIPVAASADSTTDCLGGDTCTHAAAIGDTHYDTLQEAITVASPGQTIKLCNDINPSQPIEVSKTLTLDLAGHKISNTSPIWDDSKKHWSLIRVANEGNLTLTGNGILEASQDDCYAVDLYDTGSNCTIEDGTFIGNVHAVYVFAGNLTVNGGTFSVKQKYSEEYPDEYVLNCYDDNYKNETASITVNGGIFQGFNPQDCRAEGEGTDFCSDKCIVTSEEIDGITAYTVAPLTAENAVAQVEENYFDSLEEAISKAENGDTVVLLKSTTGNENINISDGREITLNLNGFNVGFAQNGKINLTHGILNLMGRGMLYEETPYYAPVMLYGAETDQADYTVITVGEDVILQGWSGLFVNYNKAQKAYGVKATVYGTLNSVPDYTGAGGHALYINGTIKDTDGNVPEFILDGATLNTKDGNGMYLAGYAKTTITDSTIISNSEDSTGIEIRAGELEITDSTIIGGNGEYTEAPNGNGSTSSNVALAVTQHTTKLPIKITVNSGTFSANAAFVQANPQDNDQEDIDKVTLEINGGDFNGLVYSENKTKFISGGNFTHDPSEYLAEGKVAVPSTVAGYSYTVADKEETSAEVSVAAPNVAEPVAEGTEGDRALANAVYSALTDSESTTTGPSIDESALKAAANAVANDTNGTVTDQIVEDLKQATSNENITANDVTIVIQPYLDIQITDVDATSGSETITLDVTPMYRTVATTANLSEGSNEEIILSGSGEEETVNAVQIGTAQPLTVNNTVTVTIPLPENFAQGGGELFVRHVKSDNRVYFYTGSVEDNVLTFTNPNGFSEMTISKTNGAVAEIDGVGYATLTQALSEAQDGDTVTILEDGLTATMSGSERSITLKDGTNDGDSNSISLIINGQKIEIKDGKTETFTYTPPTGGGTPSEPEEPTWPFEDVTEGDDWFYDAVAYVYENGIMAGTDETTFEPYMELDRAMAAQLFYNLEGKPVVTGDSTFTDVTSGHWAVDAITWAAQNDIVAGIGGDLYDPDSNVTREQFAVMLYKYARFKGYDLTATGDLTQFPDAGSISSWAETALSWANGKGLINGHENGTIDPKGSTIRAQAASIMANFDQNVAK